MHRIPLLLPTPSVYWNRDTPEHTLFEKTMNERNIEETESFLSTLDEEAENFGNRKRKIVPNQIEDAQRLVYSEQYLEGLMLLNNLILSAPKESDALEQALKMRGGWYLQKNYLEGAINDYEMFLYSIKERNDYAQLCEIHGSLTIAYYLLRHYEKSKKHMSSYNKYKDKLSKENSNYGILEKINTHISNFKRELDDFNNMAPKSNTPWQDVPYLGFNERKEIKPMSSACTYINIEQNERKFYGVYPKVDLPKGSAVLLEKPLSTSVNVPLVQCELCLYSTSTAYTCLHCRYKTYCSITCIEKDQRIHQYECAAYKSLIVYILDARDLYRLFIKVSMHLDEHVFSQKTFRKPTSAADILEKIWESVDIENSEFGFMINILRVKPNYKQINNMQYATLIVTAFRLTMFIFRKANLLQRFYKKLRIRDTEKMVVVGVILMRLFCHLLLNTFDFEFLVPLMRIKESYKTVYEQIAEWTKIINPVRLENTESISERFNIAEAEIIEFSTRSLGISEEQGNMVITNFAPLKHTQLCNFIERPLSTFKDKLVELYFSPSDMQYIMYGEMADIPTSFKSISVSIAEMSRMERRKFVRSFVSNFHIHFLDYFLQLGVRFNQVHQILSLQCPTLRKFKHSCNPNVNIVLLDNGLLMGTTIRDIKKGEELVVSYKANFMRHTRMERTAFLKHINIQCQCKVCQIPVETESIDIRQGIYCATCPAHILTPSQEKCSKCGKNFNILLLKYRKEVAVMEHTIESLTNPESDERKLYLINSILYLRIKNHFVPSNEHRIQVELRYARYLALKNFAQQSYQVLNEIKMNTAQHYDTDFLWFSFYSEMLLIIKIIMHYNVDEKLNPMPLCFLEDLCQFALYVLNGQREKLCLLKRDTKEYTEIYDEIKIFKKWKENLHYIGSKLNTSISEENKSIRSETENLTNLAAENI
ncbi:uncharacterized protein LOC105215746 isoform X1 [Zeugodacus cucurbitae]|uniref:uncharacterized protein LOC105215746 isoform X1 n=2 Tax=Zeugodacus cucurbitae TaxID=28588 RepID=UPI0023D90C47|nr:uncharacterized protein LOC105215746 isoform X1 [Zeugodacus cucurbitae]